MIKANVTINKDLCKKCKICVHFCPKKVFRIDQDGYPLISHLEKCTGCRLCFLHCPDFALEVETELDD